MTVYLRKAWPTDAGRTGEILWESSQNLAWERDLFSCAEAIACCGQMIDQGGVTVAVLEGQVQAFLARDGTEIAALYVAGAANRKGLGKLLVEQAQGETEMLRLWGHPENNGARRFYRRLGFVETGGGTAGGASEEITFVWRQESAT